MKAINDSFHELYEILNCRKQELLELACDIVDQKIARLRLQRDELESSVSILQRKIANEKSMTENAMNERIAIEY